MAAERTGRRHLVRVAVWTALVAAVVALLLWYRSEVNRWSRPEGVEAEPHLAARPAGSGQVLIVWLGPSDDVLSREHLIAVNSAASAWKKAGGRGRLVVVAGEVTRRLSAKVILHSWGVGHGRVRLLDEEETLAASKGQRLGLAPGVPGELAARLRASGAEASALPAIDLPARPAPKKIGTVAVVLGNEPLDASTPTLDLVRRTLKAAEFYRANPGTLLVFTGGPTVGGLSEARMMAAIALSRGVPAGAVRLEEKATSTRQNALLCAEILRELEPGRVVVISKRTHLEKGMGLFRRLPAFEKAETVAADVTDEEIIGDMEAYLRLVDSPRVRKRLEALKAGIHGVD